MRLLRGVDDLVTTQRARLAKSLTTDLANERPLASVNGHVTRQVVLCVEVFAALWAAERLHTFA